MQGRLHLIERLDHVTRLPDGRWITGYWELSETERAAAKQVFLHRAKAEPAHWGGEILEVLPAAGFAELARKHDSNPVGRWVLVVRPLLDAKGARWEGPNHVMAYKSLA
jgi:hypothetical protein